MRSFGYAERAEQGDAFLGAKVPVGVRPQSHETDVHDAGALQISNGVSERVAHALHLMVLSFRKDDAQRVRIDPFDRTLPGDISADVDPARHGVCDVGTEALAYPHAVLLFMVSLGRKERLDDAAIVRKEYESVAVLVESSDRKDVRVRVAFLEVVQDLFLSFLRAVGHRSARLVVGEVHETLRWSVKEHLHGVAWLHLVPEYRADAVQQYLAGCDKFIRLFSGRIAVLREVPVDAYRGGVGVRGRFARHMRCAVACTGWFQFGHLLALR